MLHTCCFTCSAYYSRGSAFTLIFLNTYFTLLTAISIIYFKFGQVILFLETANMARRLVQAIGGGGQEQQRKRREKEPRTKRERTKRAWQRSLSYTEAGKGKQNLASGLEGFRGGGLRNARRSHRHWVRLVLGSLGPDIPAFCWWEGMTLSLL